MKNVLIIVVLACLANFILGTALMIAAEIKESKINNECRVKALNFPECCRNDECFYLIVDFKYLEKVKASVQVVAKYKLTEQQLKTAAKEIYELISGSGYERIFIEYYLPGMESNKGAWATTHFNPNLEVRIQNWMLEYNPPTSE